MRTDFVNIARTLFGPELGTLPPSTIDLQRGVRATTTLLDLWILADYIGDEMCKNEVINNLISEHRAGRITVYPTHSIQVFGSTIPDSGLRMWFVDAVLPAMTVSTLEANRLFFPQGFIFQSFKRLIAKQGTAEKSIIPKEADACSYHYHAPGQPRCNGTA